MSGGVMAEEDIEYESDPEELKMSLKMRRRQASDDEEEGGDDGEEKPVRRVDEFDGESEGAVAEYEDDLEEEDYYDLDEENMEEEIEEAKYGERGSEIGGGSVLVVPVDGAQPVKAGFDGDMGEEIVVKNGAEIIDEIRGGHEEDKKEIEPYAVPTAGAFYMHDDRFQDNTRGRNRRMLAGRKLWESKDNRKWGHDMFEELTTPERLYEERRGSRGNFRGRGKNRGTGLGYARGYRSDNHSNISSQNSNNRNNAPKRMRGRGPRRYQPSLKNNEGYHTQNKQKSVEKSSYVTSIKTSESASNAEMDMILPRKQGFASNLSIASPPFYPSGSSSRHNAVEHKRDVQAGTSNRNSQQSAVDESFNVTKSSAMLKGKSIVDSIGVQKLAIGDSLSATVRKPLNNMHLPVSSSLSTNAAQNQMRGHGRGKTSSTKLAYQPTYSNNQVNRVPTPNQLQTVPRYPGQTPAQSSVQTPDQQVARVPSSHAASPPKVAVIEPSKLEYPSEYSKSTTASVATGIEKSHVQGRGSFLYGGAHVMGASDNVGAAHADQNFPAFLPVMQFGGKHPGGMGVPAVGMAFPGYVGRQQLGLGNSEMTWLPVIAGAAGALGAQYRPPFISADGSYHTQPSSGKVSTVTAALSKENKVVSAELTNDESGQRQKNPRRYTEMKFDQ
ncbi:protein MLN51 homolog [Henckelia pumila]|uniref:protein MLN51 homolog n=1 Tax=Henckelia pumila TaxID=405737 RepID=UPI003C6E421E